MNHLGIYYPTHSFWHGLDPRSVLFTMAAVMISLLGGRGLGVLVGIGIVLFLYRTGGLPTGFVIQPLLKFKWLLLITLMTNWFWATPMQERGILEHQFVRAIWVTMRLSGTLLIANWLCLVVRPARLIEAFIWLLKPLVKFKIPTLDLALILMLVVRFVPELLAESDNIIIAQRLRGVQPKFKWAKSGLWVRSTLIPVFKLSIRKAATMAVAMEARGYSPGVSRSSMEELKFDHRDYLVVILACSAIILIIAKNWL